MKVQSLLKADRWIGLPLCFVLSLLRTAFSKVVPDGAHPPRSILFVKLAEQGSTVLAYPALRRAVNMVGRENVYFVALEENRFILDLLGVLPAQNVITIRAASARELFSNGLRAIRKLRMLKLDAALDLEFFSRGSAVLTFLSGARRRVGFHAFHGGGPYRGDLMTHRLIFNPHLHTSQTFLTLVEALSRDPAELPAFDFSVALAEDEPPRFRPSAEEVASMKELRLRAAGAGSPLILLNPNSSDLLPLRRWAADRYAELARRLLAKYPEVVIGFTGALSEAATARDLAQRVGSSRCISLAGQTTLRELLVLFSLAEVLVTNDSGPAHFATLTPIRVVTLFGPETPALFAARTPRNRVLWAGIACSPCVSAYNNRQSPCRNNLCMQAITVDQVFEEVCRAYQEKREADSKLAGL
jgi:ADP-heptose:LPS heptosyltransferase